MENKETKAVFISADKQPALDMIKGLKWKNIESDWSSYAGRYLINVNKEDYHKALTNGAEICKNYGITRDICWVNHHNEVVDNVTVWPVAYCLLDLTRHGLDDKKSLSPSLWMTENEGRITSENLINGTPAEIKKIYKDIKDITKHGVLTHWNFADQALEFRAICNLDELNEIRQQYLDYFKKIKFFDKIIPLEFDGLLDKENMVVLGYKTNEGEGEQ